MVKQLLSGQLRIGDDDVSGYPLARIVEKISAAHHLAGMTRLLYFPSLDQRINDGVLEHCRQLGLEVYFWYKVLAGNNVLSELDESCETAWGQRGFGESGLWRSLPHQPDYYRFACPHAAEYNALLLNRCRHSLKAYDGLFVDCIGFPSPSLGLESVFSCFCPRCLELEPRLTVWRDLAMEMRETIISAADEDLERWGTMRGVIREFGLVDYFSYRFKTMTTLAGRYADIAKVQGKDFGLDIAAPALSDACGHDYQALGKITDWLKPRLYCRTYGPSSIPLEFHCLAMGMKIWGRRLGMSAVMAFIERSIGIPMPPNIFKLSQSYLPPETVGSEIAKAMEYTTAPIYPGIECSFHPDFPTGLDESMVKSHIQAASGCPGITLSWNILHIPDAFLRLFGEG